MYDSVCVCRHQAPQRTSESEKRGRSTMQPAVYSQSASISSCPAQEPSTTHQHHASVPGSTNRLVGGSGLGTPPFPTPCPELCGDPTSRVLGTQRSSIRSSEDRRARAADAKEGLAMPLPSLAAARIRTASATGLRRSRKVPSVSRYHLGQQSRDVNGPAEQRREWPRRAET